MIGGFGLAPSLPCVLPHSHTDQGPKFIAEAGEGRIAAVGVRTTCVERDSRENGCVEIALSCRRVRVDDRARQANQGLGERLSHWSIVNERGRTWRAPLPCAITWSIWRQNRAEYPQSSAVQAIVMSVTAAIVIAGGSLEAPPLLQGSCTAWSSSRDVSMCISALHHDGNGRAVTHGHSAVLLTLKLCETLAEKPCGDCDGRSRARAVQLLIEALCIEGVRSRGNTT
jgi:hypothetical protein